MAFAEPEFDIPPLDETDRTLLTLLRERADRRYADLAERLHLSAAAVHGRVRRLRRQGVIRRTTIDVDPRALGFTTCAFIQVVLSRATCDDVVPELHAQPEIEEIHSVAGRACLMLRVRTANTKELERLLVRIWRIDGVASTESMVVLDTYVDNEARVR